MKVNIFIAITAITTYSKMLIPIILSKSLDQSDSTSGTAPVDLVRYQRIRIIGESERAFV